MTLILIFCVCFFIGYCVGGMNSTPGRDRDHDWRRSEDRPVRFEPGRVQRSNSGNPTTIKPAIVPKPQFPPARRISSWQWPGDY